MFVTTATDDPALAYDPAEVETEFADLHVYGVETGDPVRAWEFMVDAAPLVEAEPPESPVEVSAGGFIDFLDRLPADSRRCGELFASYRDILNVMARDPAVSPDVRHRLVYHPNLDVATAALRTLDDPYALAEVFYDTDRLPFDLDDLREAALGQAMKVRGDDPTSPFDFVATAARWERPREFMGRGEFIEWMSGWFQCSWMTPTLLWVSEPYRQRCYLDRGEWPPFGYFCRIADWLRDSSDLEVALAVKLTHIEPTFDRLVVGVAALV